MRKSPLELTFEERKSVLVQSCFLEIADLDYLTARWTYHNGIFHNFYWSAAQCIEKYLKASLLYSNQSVKNISHDLCKLYKRACMFCPDLKIETIVMPPTTGMGRACWDGKSMSLFIDYVNLYGSPDARYAMVGTMVNGPIIHPLDYLCARVRQCIRHNNFLGGDMFIKSQTDAWSDEQVRVDHPWMINNELPLERLFNNKYHVGQSELLRSVFRNMNFAFFGERDATEATFGGQHFTMAPLRNHLFRLRELDKSAENMRIIDELRIWAQSHMKLPKDIKAALAASS